MHYRLGGIADGPACGGVDDPLIEHVCQRCIVVRAHGRIRIQEKRGIAAGVMTGAEQYGRTEGGGFEDGVKAGRMESTADERHVGERIEIAQHADAVDDDDVGIGCIRFTQSRSAETFRGCPACDGGEMRRRRLVWSDDDAWPSGGVEAGES